MKNLIMLFLFSLLLCSCEGSESYQGKWKALDANKNKFEIVFKPNSFSVKDRLGKTTQYDYSQNYYQYKNGVVTYGISLDDGRRYQIHFPKRDKSAGFILDENSTAVYSISRTRFMSYDDIYKL